jgi:16S rRNA (cytidine1402-2'-O)-methyltransferase
MSGTLYLVATPIGNLQDTTLRALETLRSVGIIACEDTRHTRKLLNHFEISAKLVSYHEHNEAERAARLIEELISGTSVAVVSDAGTPGIADPSFRIVELAVANGVSVVPIPGCAAFVAAAIASGLPTDSIFFGGFLPSKSGDRRKRLEEIRAIPATLVLYEAPHRIGRSLADCLDVLGDRRAVVAREITKLHETHSRGSLSSLVAEFSGATTRGEIVLVIDRRSESVAAPAPSSLAARVAELEAEGFDNRSALKKAAKELGLTRSEAYRLMISNKK